jgi:hypothetical protein
MDLFSEGHEALQVNRKLRGLFGTGNFGYIFRHVVQSLRSCAVRGTVVDFLAIPAADNEAAGFQQLQVMGEGGAGHIHHDGEIQDALLTVAQEPEKPETGLIAQQFKQVGSRCEGFRIGHMVKGLFHGAVVVMGQYGGGH